MSNKFRSYCMPTVLNFVGGGGKEGDSYYAYDKSDCSTCYNYDLDNQY